MASKDVSFFNASMEPPDSLGSKPSSQHVLIRGNTPAHGLGEPAVKEVEAELSRTTTVRTKKMLSAIKDGTQQVGDQQRRMIIGATMVLLFSMVFLAGSTLAVVYTRETHVDSNSSGPVLVDNDDHAVSTGTAYAEVNLRTLPLNGPGFDYNLLNDVRLPLGGRNLGFKVVGYEWYNTTDMDFFLANFGPEGLTLHISNGSLIVSEGATAAAFFGDASEQADRRRLSIAKGRQLLPVWLVPALVEGGKMVLGGLISYGITKALDGDDDDDDDGGPAETESEDGDDGEQGETTDGGETGVHNQDGSCPPKTIC